MSKRLRQLCQLSVLIVFALFLLYSRKYLYIWNRVTLQNAEPSQFIEQRSAFLPVEGRPKHVIYHVMAAGRDETNSSLPTIMSTKRRDQTNDADRLPVWEATSAWTTLDGTAGDDKRLKRRSLEYCNRQRLKWSETSEEGILLPNYRLVGVAMVTRHGDRSPMYTLPNHVTPRLSCSFQLSPTATSSSSSVLRSTHQTGGAVVADGDDSEDDSSKLKTIRRFVAAMQSLIIDNSSISSRLFRRFGLLPNNTLCYGAQLTSAGAIQMYWLGRFLRSRYPDLAGVIPNDGDVEKDDEDDRDAEAEPLPPRVYVRSTEYPRTFQSAAALLYGFGGRRTLTTATFETTRNIYFCSESTTGGGNVTCTCPSAVKMLAALKKNKTYSADERKVRNEIARVFNVTSSRLPWMSAMMEVFMAYACHGLPLPCGPQNRCISWNIVDWMWTLSDNDDNAGVERRRRHVNQTSRVARPLSASSSTTVSDSEAEAADNPRTLSSKLLAYPMLREIAQRLLDLTLYRTRRTAPNFIVFSGHDKTVSTAARALGIFDNRWPPYGSRLVIELLASSSRDRPRHFIRVLYNGRDATRMLEFCPPSQLVDDALCPLDNFAFSVFDRYSRTGDGKKTYAEACSL